MACPACDHTMQSFGVVPLGRLFWCNRCGSVKIVQIDGSPPDAADWLIHKPMLADRVREFLSTTDGQFTKAVAWRFGLHESVGLTVNSWK